MQSTKKHCLITPDLIEEFVHAVTSVGEYGSVEVYVQNAAVTQITVRTIKKTTQTNHKTANRVLEQSRATTIS